MTTHLEVNRADHADTRVHTTAEETLRPGEIRVTVDLVSLTANNVTYAVMGDALDYWAFFPTEDPAWGRVPAMGFGDVAESAHDDVTVGTRLYGWFPMSSSVVLRPEVRRTSLVDTVEHRAGHAPVYRTYQLADLDPMHVADDEARDALLRGLYVTSWLVDARLHADHPDAATVVVTSASSKTGLALAHRRRSADRAGRTIGLTSPRNIESVRARDVYDEVLAYDDAARLDSQGESVVVDLAGNATTLAAVHHALADTLALSLTVGVTHGPPTGLPEGVPGPPPTFFFAPTEIKREVERRGTDGYSEALAQDLHGFVTWASGWLEVEQVTEADGAREAFERVRSGAVPADVGVILRPSAW